MNETPPPPSDFFGDASEEQRRSLPPDWEYEEEPVLRSRPRRERAVVLLTDEGSSIIRAGDAALDEEDLPVLTAFREFLEAERRRTRRQIRLMIAFFTIAFLIIAAGGAWVVRQWILRFEEKLESEKALSLERQAETVSNLQTVARAAVNLRREVQENTQKSVAVEADLARQREEIARLLDSLRVLEVENALLERAVRRMEPERISLTESFPGSPVPPTPATGVTETVSPRPLPPLSGQEARPTSKTSESPPGQTTPSGIRYRLSVPKE